MSLGAGQAQSGFEFVKLTYTWLGAICEQFGFGCVRSDTVSVVSRMPFESNVMHLSYAALISISILAGNEQCDS